MLRSAPIVSYDVQQLRKEGFHSQYGQDKFIVEKLFAGKQQGIFVDVGAYDGITISNTFYLEQHLGWSGVCIEPNPAPFAALRSQRRCRAVNACLGAKAGTVEFQIVMSSSCPGIAMLSGMTHSQDPRHSDRVSRELQEASAGATQTLPIRCLSFSQLAKEEGLSQIDYVSIDVEGGELDVIDGIEQSSCAIDVISCEINYRNYQIPTRLHKLGYRMIARLGVDEFYRRRT